MSDGWGLGVLKDAGVLDATKGRAGRVGSSGFDVLSESHRTGSLGRVRVKDD